MSLQAQVYDSQKCNDHCCHYAIIGEPVEEGELESVVGGEMIDLVIPVDGDNDGTSVVEELVYAGMKRKWTE